MDGWMDGWIDGWTSAKVRTERSGLSSCLQPRHSSSLCRVRGGMNAFHYESYLLPDLSTLSASFVLHSFLRFLSFSRPRSPVDSIERHSRSRRIRRRSGKIAPDEKRRKTLSSTKAQPSLYLSTARFIVGKPADFFSFLNGASAATHRPVSRVEQNDN